MMRHAVQMPRFEADAVDGRILSWLKEVGSPVKRGEPIAEIETDKTTIELEAIVTGTLVEIVHEEGTDVAIGDVIAYIETE